MPKLLIATFVLLFLLAAPPEPSTLAKYKAVESYEVLPGILAFPRYAEDGRVCEVGVERRHYSSEKIVLYSTLSRQDIDAIVDELAPANERGPKSEVPLNDVGVAAGMGMTTSVEYENVTVEIYSAVTPGSESKDGAKRWRITVDNVVAVIRYKNRKCK